MSAALDLSPSFGAAPRRLRWAAQTRLEWQLVMANGEQLLLTFVIPLVALIAVSRMEISISVATAGVMALAVLSSSFTSTAISTGFERRSGTLKLLRSTPLGTVGLLIGKISATLAVLALQLIAIAGVGVFLGWTPSVSELFSAAFLMLLGAAALGSWGFALAGLLRAEATLAVANAVFLLLMVAGGTALSTDRLPQAIAPIVRLLPTAALGDGLRNVLGATPDPAFPWLAAASLSVWALSGVLVARRTFRWE